jgi:hypothetical protein
MPWLIGSGVKPGNKKDRRRQGRGPVRESKERQQEEKPGIKTGKDAAVI